MFRVRFAVLAFALLTPLLPAAHAAPATSLAFAGIRPGTLLVIGNPTVRPLNYDDTHACTANFVFQDAPGAFDPSGQLYIGTAGHCVSLGQTVRAIAAAPGTTTPVLVTVGTTVADDDTINDYALVAIDPAMNSWVSPSVAYWGGPTAAYTGPDDVSIPGTQVGHAGLAGGFLPRVGTIESPAGPAFGWFGLTAEGDSGSPVTTYDGLAIGQLVRLTGTTLPGGVNSAGPTVGLMTSATGKTLATCPTRTPWPAPGCPPV
jgi:hypothetical protein